MYHMILLEKKIIFERNCHFPQKLEISCIYLQTNLVLGNTFCAITGYEALTLEIRAHSQYPNKLSEYAD